MNPQHPSIDLQCMKKSYINISQRRSSILGSIANPCIVQPIHLAHSLLQSIYQPDHLPCVSGLHFHETEIFPWHQFHPPAQQALCPHHLASLSKPTGQNNMKDQS